MPIPKEAWESFGNMLNSETGDDIRAKRPDKGKYVKVTGGRKHKGKEGIIFWHGEDRYNPPYRYCGNDLQAAMRQAIGIYGFRVGIKTDDGERFFVPADYVKIIENK